MSSTTSPDGSPAPIQPLHNPSQAAHIVVPQAPLGNVVNQAPGMGAKALLAKKMAKTLNPTYISPTDNLMTPCTQKLNAARKKYFNKGAKPMQLFAQGEQEEVSSDEQVDEDLIVESEVKKIDTDDENPF